MAISVDSLPLRRMILSGFKARRPHKKDTLSEHYGYVRQKMPNRDRIGFEEAFRLAMLEFSCLGEQPYEPSGYTHSSTEEALYNDAATTGHDFSAAQPTVNAKLKIAQPVQNQDQEYLVPAEHYTQSKLDGKS